MIMNFTKEKIDDVLKRELAIYCARYPQLAGRLNGYFKTHPDTSMAMANIVRKFMSLDEVSEALFMKELDIKEISKNKEPYSIEDMTHSRLT